METRGLSPRFRQPEDKRRPLYQSGAGLTWQARGDQRIGSVKSIQFTGGRIYVGSDRGLFISEDQGATWNGASAIGDSVVVHPLNPRYMCSVTFSQELRCSSDGGRTSTPLNTRLTKGVVADPRAEGAFISAAYNGIQSVNLAGPSLRLAPFRESVQSVAIQTEGDQFTLWIIARGRLYVSQDSAATFGEISSDASLVAPGARGSGVVYTQRESRTDSKQARFQRSTDGGRTWTDIGVGFPSTWVLGLTVDPSIGRVLQATWLGGSRADELRAMAAGADGRIRLAGSTTSRDLPVTPNALPIGGGAKAFWLSPRGEQYKPQMDTDELRLGCRAGRTSRCYARLRT